MIEIEKIGIEKSTSKADWQDFLVALRDLKTGESFFIDVLVSNHRTVIAASKILLNTNFTTAKEGDGFRVARTS